RTVEDDIAVARDLALALLEVAAGEPEGAGDALGLVAEIDGAAKVDDGHLVGGFQEFEQVLRGNAGRAKVLHEALTLIELHSQVDRKEQENEAAGGESEAGGGIEDALE